jgi:hypothetical protein
MPLAMMNAAGGSRCSSAPQQQQRSHSLRRAAPATGRSCNRGRRSVVVRADVSTVTDSFGLLMKPEVAAVVSTAVAAISAVVGSSLAEEKKAKLEQELERERRARLEMSEINEIVSRYRWGVRVVCVCGGGGCCLLCVPSSRGRLPSAPSAALRRPTHLFSHSARSLQILPLSPHPPGAPSSSRASTWSSGCGTR